MISMIPKPNGPVHMENSRVTLPKQFGVDFGSFENWCAQALFERTGGTLSVGAPWLTLRKDPALAEEGYDLTVSPEGISVRAASERGVVWALTTVYHLLDGNGTLPVCRICDSPKYGHRGLSLDCSRHFFPVDTVEQVIEQLALTKMNVLHWHLTDDQGWRIESKKFPRLHETSVAYYSHDDIRQIVEYARVRGVEIIPEIDLPGHTTGILAAYPAFSCSGKEVPLAASGGIYTVILCAGKDQVFDFLEEMLDEICPLFPSSRFHIGGDEAPKEEWKKCPHCAKRMADENIHTEEDLQGYFTQRVAAILAKHGKNIICWNDSLKAANLPQGTAIQYWTPIHSSPMEKYYAAGGQFIYSDMFDLYFDYPYSLIPLKRVYNCIPRIGKEKCGSAPGMLGIEACVWAERIGTPRQLGTRLFPRVYALAETAWTHKRSYSGFIQRIPGLMEKAEKAGAAYTDRSWWDPRGAARRRDGIAYMKNMILSSVSCAEGENKETSIIDGFGKEQLLSYVTRFFKPWDVPAIIQEIRKFREEEK